MATGHGDRDPCHAAAGARRGPDAALVRQGPDRDREVGPWPRSRSKRLAVRKTYGGPSSRRSMGSSLTVADGEILRRARRPVGLRKVHAAAHDRRPRDDHRRARSRSAGASSTRWSPRPRHRHGVPELRALPAHDRLRQHGLRLRNRRTPKDEIDKRVREAARILAIEPSSTASRASSPAVSGSASPWAAPSCASRRCSCSTSRSRTSTPSCACRCASRSSGCSSASASPSSTSRTTRSRR